MADMLCDNDLELLLLLNEEKDRNEYLKDFDLDSLPDEDCRSMFRFEKDDIATLRTCLGVPRSFVAKNGTRVDGIEALCILLRRLSYPNRLHDLVNVFGRPAYELSYIFNGLVDFVYYEHSHLLTNLNQTWLQENDLRTFATAISNAGSPLNDCWGFIDGTVRPICRPGENQRLVFNGHKRIHGIKFQSVSTPNGMIANLYGPMEGKRHDAGMLRESGLMDQLEQYMTMADGTIYSLYGDPAYPLRPHLLAPYRGGVITAEQALFNKRMSAVRVTVEWAFGKILANFAFVDYKKNQKLYLQPVGKYYSVATLLTNCHTCLYGSAVSEFFGLQPPTVMEYLRG